MNVRKAVIPAAGLGTRMLPATKAQPKEMLPIIDKPAIQYIVEEAVASGIESILIVTGRNKTSIEDHFDKSVELEQALEAKGRSELLERVRAISGMADIHFIRQKEALGLGHAVLCAEPFIGGEPFAVLLGDDIMMSDPPALKQLIQAYDLYGKPVVGIKKVAPEEAHKYGIVSYRGRSHRLYDVSDLVEKPASGTAPSNMAIMGRYVLGPDMFKHLAAIERGAGNEYQLTDALRLSCRGEGLLALEMQGERYDIGDKFGYVKAMISMGLQRDEMRQQMLDFLQETVSRELEADKGIRAVI